ncbi:MAG TPA: RraA family protein [Anaerovoracaceae bacterium]|nr:RraA family protein [Anaerovoracaceae bacterium]
MDKIRIKPRKVFVTEHLKNKIAKADIAAIGHYTEFGFMDPRIRTMTANAKKIYGTAVTVRIPAQDSKAVHLAVSMAEEGDVLVIDRTGDTTHACVGEMIALCASVRKLSAIVVDGPITDLDEIIDIGIPVFATGTSALTTKFIKDCGEINYDISCGGVAVHPGDLIMADRNGVLVLREFEAESLIDQALEDQDYESKDKDMVKRGKTLQQLYVPEYPL